MIEAPASERARLRQTVRIDFSQAQASIFTQRHRVICPVTLRIPTAYRTSRGPAG